MYCGECGAKLKKNAEFCGECGAKVHQKEEEEKKPKKVVKKTERKPMSKKKKAIIITVVVLVVAVIGSYWFLSKRFGPEGVATEYLEAMISNDADRIYNALNLSGDTTFATKEAFEKVFDSLHNGYDDVVNYKVIDVEYNEGKLTANVEFQIASEGSEEDTITIRVIKNSQKKFLIFDSWQVSNVSNSLLVKDYQITVPKNSTVTVNDIALESKYLNNDKSTEELDVYVIPQIFVGTTTIKTVLPCGIEETSEQNISSYNTSYKADVSLESLTDEMKTTLEEQVKKDLTTLYANIIAKKDWNSIKESYNYANADLKNLEQEYEDLYEELVTDSDVTLKAFEVTDVNITDFSLNDNQLEISAKFTYKYTVDYQNFNNETKTKEGNSSYTTSISYNYVDNAYKINDIYGTVTYFSTW